jgi:phenylalanyl-tRNA synthetase alpha chain
MPLEIPELKDYSPASLDSFFAAIQTQFDQDVAGAASAEAVERLRVRWIGRKQGLLTRVSEVLKGAPAEARRAAGMRFNALKSAIEPRCDPQQVGTTGVIAEAIDITLPGTRRALGAEHPLIRTMNEIVSVFAAMGYSVGVGPEVETDYYNFESLNFPPGHPARDTQDTLVIAQQERKPLRDRLLMRTHTSPVQIHTMEEQPPPLRIVIPGKVHRNDALDATHSPIFHQVEGLCVDTNITFSDLKGTLDYAMKAFFGSSVKTRFFPVLLPLHRAVGRCANQLPFLWRPRLPQMQALGMD